MRLMRDADSAGKAVLLLLTDLHETLSMSSAECGKYLETCDLATVCPCLRVKSTLAEHHMRTFLIFFSWQTWL